MARTRPAESAPARHGTPRPVIALSHAMQQVMARVARYAPSHTPVLLRGEPGTGKDTIARAIHSRSPFCAGAFVKLSCDYADDDEVLFLLLGDSYRAPQATGLLTQARHGTLFFSEIGHFSLRLQHLLVQLLRQKPFISPTDQRPHCSEARLVCASEVNLEQEVAAGRFLAELYYRLHVAYIPLPGLQERREDIPALVQDFLMRFNRRNHTHVAFDPDALSPLYLCQWPGNLRDLENCLEYAVLHRTDDVIRQLPCIHACCLRKRLNLRMEHYACRQQTAPTPQWDPCATPSQVQLPTGASLSGNDAEDELRHRFIAALEKSGWVKAKAARLLNITPRQLYYALQKLNIEVRKF